MGLDGWRLVGDLSVYGCWWGLVCYSLYLFLCLLVSGFVLLVHRFAVGCLIVVLGGWWLGCFRLLVCDYGGWCFRVGGLPFLRVFDCVSAWLMV